MGKKLDAVLLLILLVLLSCGAGCADIGGLAISGKTGTLGMGGELTTGIAPNVNARVGINTMDLDFEGDIDDIEFDIGADFSSFSALVDYYVFDGSFRVSGGIVSMNHELALKATGAAGEREDIGDGNYDWETDIGTLSGSVEIDDVAPYVGIGWGNTLGRNKRWGFYTDLGIAFAGSPDAKLSATGAGATPGLAEDLAKEEDEIQDELDAFRFYPVLSMGLFFRF
ncbi:MAG: hypothetical protein ISS70_20300 [Phycisphaerae bacterium]|nr:hypothetical protein [Phycisphaerae bacterium]